jgi:hypothetical protein
MVMLKLKHDLGIENLTLLERKRGCMGIHKLVVFIMSCFSPNKSNIFISMILLVSAVVG